MSICTVLSILNSKSHEEDLKAAVEFCRGAGAHLSTVVICMGSAPMNGVYGAASIAWLDAQQREIDDLSERTAQVREVLSRSELSYDVQEIYTDFAWAQEDIAERALYADVVLIGRQAAGDEDLRKRIIGGALFRTPTPVIINRGTKPLQSNVKSVLLAWDSSDEASRAARQALDFLKAAECVYVTMVDPLSNERVNGEDPGADVGAFLARHGVKVQVDRLTSGGSRSDDVIRQHAIDVGADLIVMGAYNHPRWQQTLFGGMTRNMIEDGKTPIFLSR